MAFTVEDGTGVPGSNSYASVAQADAYFADVGQTGWQGSDVVKQLALVRATRYERQRWGARLSALLAATRAVPYELVAATSEYALRTLDGTPLAPDPATDSNGVALVMTKRTIGPLTREYKVLGDTGATPPVYRSYPVPDSLIGTVLGALGGGGGVLRVIR